MTETATAAIVAAPEPTTAENNTEPQTENQEGQDAAAEALEAAPDFKKWKHKVALPEGEEEVDYEELKRNYAKNKVLTQREQANASLKKQVEQERDKLAQFLTAAKNDPNLIWQLAQELGHDPENLAIMRAREAMEWDKKSAEEKRAITAERKEAQLAQRLKEIEDEKIASEKDHYAKLIEKETENDVLAVIKELGDEIDLNEADIETIAQIQAALYDTRETKPEPQEVAKYVLARRQQVAERYLKNLIKNGKVEALPKELLNSIQKFGVEKARSASKVPTIPPSHSTASGSKKDAKKQNIGVDTFFKNLGR